MARTDAQAVEGLAAAIDRANAYVGAGAHLIFAEALTTLGVDLLGLAIGWYQDADESEGHSGAFGALQSEADALHGNGGAYAQMRSEHERELARARAAKTKGRAA